jgi:hypothetical protein
MLIYWHLESCFGSLFFFPGMAQFVSNFAEPGDLEYAPPIKEAETRVEFSTYYICSILFLWFLITIL